MKFGLAPTTLITLISAFLFIGFATYGPGIVCRGAARCAPGQGKPCPYRKIPVAFILRWFHSYPRLPSVSRLAKKLSIRSAILSDACPSPNGLSSTIMDR